MERVSIALATYNGGKYLQEQLSSFINQTRQPDELIVCDDKSTDETLNIVHKFSRKASFPVSVFLNDSNLGFSQNFSKVLELCSGDFIFLSDQDDMWKPKKIEHMVNIFKENPSYQLLIHDLEYCREDLSPIGQTKMQRMYGTFDLQTEYVVGMASAVRKDFLKICLPVPGKHYPPHDVWLHQCAVALGVKKILPEVLALYRRHGNNVTSERNLNVDFVTGPDFYKKKKMKVINLVKEKTKIYTPNSIILLEWLKKNKNILEKKYCTKKYIDNYIRNESLFVNNVKKRNEILYKRRYQRMLYVIRFYMKGGYNSFSGWKSALKDLLIN